MATDPEYSFGDRALFHEGALVIADLHVGRGAASRVDAPVGDGSDMVERLERLCATFEPDEVVVAGDLLHSFETVPRLVEDTLGGLQAVADEHGARMIVTPGNHDTLLEAVWSGPTAHEHRLADGTVVCHGHVEPEAAASRYVIGHDHPTVTIEGQRRPCALVGASAYRGADVVMLPSFNRLVRGVEINELSAADFLSPLVTDVDGFRPVVYDSAADETFVFPALGELRHRL